MIILKFKLIWMAVSAIVKGRVKLIADTELDIQDGWEFTRQSGRYMRIDL